MHRAPSYPGFVMSCQFCKNISGSLASAAIYSDNFGCAFADITSGGSIHVVIVPRERAHLLYDTDMRNSADLGHLLEMAAEIARARHLSGGYRIFANAGDEGDQNSDHLHVHLIDAQHDHDSLLRPASTQLTAELVAETRPAKILASVA